MIQLGLKIKIKSIWCEECEHPTWQIVIPKKLYKKFQKTTKDYWKVQEEIQQCFLNSVNKDR